MPLESAELRGGDPLVVEQHLLLVEDAVRHLPEARGLAHGVVWRVSARNRERRGQEWKKGGGAWAEREEDGGER